MTAVSPSIHTLNSTARWTAAVRAAETARPDGLVDDPWAAVLAGPEGAAWFAARPEGSTVPIAIRTRYFDDWLRAVAIEHEAPQVVLLAAGFDTRAWRLPWAPGTTLFEVDHGAVLEEKARLLAAAGAPPPGAARRSVDADLAADWGAPLLDAGFDAGLPTVWLAEGILFYLRDDVVADVLARVSALSVPGSRLGFDIPNALVLTSPYTRAWIEMQAAAGAPWLGTMDDPAATLEALGWVATVTQPGEGTANHGRWTLPVPPASMTDVPHSWYVIAERA